LATETVLKQAEMLANELTRKTGNDYQGAAPDGNSAALHCRL
jgi:hypothetical protein